MKHLNTSPPNKSCINKKKLVWWSTNANGIVTYNLNSSKTRKTKVMAEKSTKCTKNCNIAQLKN